MDRPAGGTTKDLHPQKAANPGPNLGWISESELESAGVASGPWAGRKARAGVARDIRPGSPTLQLEYPSRQAMPARDSDGSEFVSKALVDVNVLGTLPSAKDVVRPPDYDASARLVKGSLSQPC